jgi:hypothetical protein
MEDDDVADLGLADLEHGEAIADLDRRRHALGRRAVEAADEHERDHHRGDQTAPDAQQQQGDPPHRTGS